MTANEISTYFIIKYRNEGRELTLMRILILLYISQGLYLASNGEELFEDRIEAWKFGPVVPLIYKLYKNFGTDNIDIFDESNLGKRLSNDTKRVRTR